MAISMNKLRAMLSALVAGVAIVAVGCTESTTRDDVTDAREDLREEQQDTAEARQDAQEEIVDARQDAQEHTVGKPVMDEDATEARQDVAEARQDASEDVAEEKQDEAEAAADLRGTQQDLQATQARDAFVKQTEQQLTDIESKIDQMEERASNATDAEKEAINLQIETLQAQHDRAEEALGELKGADLANWQTHQENVRVAMQELNSGLGNVR